MRAVRGIRQDPRAAAVARLRSLRGADPAYADLSQLLPNNNDNDGPDTLLLDKVNAVNKAAKTMKLAINDRDDKFKWREEYYSLMNEEQVLTLEIEQWMENHKEWAIPSTMDDHHKDPTTNDTHKRSPLEAEALAVANTITTAATATDTNTTDTTTTMNELLSTVLESKYTLTLQKRTLHQHLQRLHRILDHYPTAASSSKRSSRHEMYRQAQSELKTTILYFNDEAETLMKEMIMINDSLKKDKDLSKTNSGNGEETAVNVASPTNNRKKNDPFSPSSPSTNPSYLSLSSPSTGQTHPKSDLRNQCITTLNSIGGVTCEDSTLFNQLLDGLLKLENDYVKDIHELNENWQNLCNVCGTTMEQQYGGWTQDAHLAYKQGLQFGKSKTGAGKARITRYLQQKQQLERIREQNQRRQHGSPPDDQPNDGTINTDSSPAKNGYGNDDTTEDDYLALSPSTATNTLIESNEALYDTIRLLVQDITRSTFNPSRTNIEQHHRWSQEQKHYKQRKSAREAQYIRERKEYLEHTRRSFEKATILAENLRIRARTLAEHEKVRQEAHQRLEINRARKAVEDAIAQSIADEMAAAESAVQELNSLARKARAEKMKKALERYYDEQKRIETRIDEIKQQQALDDLERKKAQAITDHERIEYRAKLLTQKADHAKQLAKEALELERQKEALLENFIKKNVDYYERIEEIANTTDKERITAHTVASKTSTEISLAYAYYIKAIHNQQTNGAETDNKVDDEVTKKVSSHDTVDFAIAAKYAPDRPDGLIDTMNGTGTNPSKSVLLSLANQRIKEKGLFGKFGYSEKQITGDKRWRFVSSAWAAGIQGTSAARDALQNIKPVGRGVLQVNQATTSQISW